MLSFRLLYNKRGFLTGNELFHSLIKFPSVLVVKMHYLMFEIKRELQLSSNVTEKLESLNCIRDFLTITIHYLSVITFFIFRKVHSIQAMRYIVLCHPLVCILPSLGRDPNDLRCSTKVNLQPLIPIIVSRGPGPYVPPTATAMETSKVRGVVSVPRRRRCDHVIFETTRL